MILALQGDVSRYEGVSNLNVVMHVTRLLVGVMPARPIPLVEDGGLLGMVYRLLQFKGAGASLGSKVKGHADDGMVR